MAKESSWRDALSVDFVTEMMTAFSSDLHEQNVKQWLGLFAELMHSLVFSKEFLRRGGLRTLLTMLRIPHINIVFLVVRVLKAIKGHGLIDTPEFSNASRQQLAKFLAEYHQERPKTTTAVPVTSAPKQSVIERVATKLIEPVKTAPKIEVPSAQATTLTKIAPRSDKLPNVESNSSNKAASVDKSKKSEKLKVSVPKIERKVEKKTTELRKSSITAQGNELADELHRESCEQFQSPILNEIQILQSCSSVEEQVYRLQRVQRYLSHSKVSSDLCSKICDALIPLLRASDSRVFVETCTLLHYIACFEELHEMFKEKGMVQLLIDEVNGYNLQRIEYSLWVLDKFCSDNQSIMTAVELHIIPSLGVVMNSGIENVRLYAQFILKRIAKTGIPELHEDLKRLNANDPWYKVAKGWNEILPWSPADYII
jgi:hypothetical protein